MDFERRDWIERGTRINKAGVVLCAGHSPAWLSHEWKQRGWRVMNYDDILAYCREHGGIPVCAQCTPSPVVILRGYPGIDGAQPVKERGN